MKSNHALAKKSDEPSADSIGKRHLCFGRDHVHLTAGLITGGTTGLALFSFTSLGCR